MDTMNLMVHSMMASIIAYYSTTTTANIASKDVKNLKYNFENWIYLNPMYKTAK